MTTVAHSFFNGSSLYLQITRTTINPMMALNFDQIQMLTRELAVPLSIFKLILNIEATLPLSFLIGSSSSLQVFFPQNNHPLGTPSLLTYPTLPTLAQFSGAVCPVIHVSPEIPASVLSFI